MNEPLHMATGRFNARLMRYAPRPFAAYAISTFLFVAGQILPGLVVQAIFDRLTGHEAAGLGIPALVALFVWVVPISYEVSAPAILRAEQEHAARTSKQELEKSGQFSRPIVTQIIPAVTFYEAEDYHQQYLEKRGLASCHIK